MKSISDEIRKVEEGCEKVYSSMDRCDVCEKGDLCPSCEAEFQTLQEVKKLIKKAETLCTCNTCKREMVGTKEILGEE